MKPNKQKFDIFSTQAILLLATPIVIASLYFMLQKLGFVSILLSPSQFQLLILPFFETIILLTFFKHYYSARDANNSQNQKISLFLFSLINFVLVVWLEHYYGSIVSVKVPWVTLFVKILFALKILLGLLAFVAQYKIYSTTESLNNIFANESNSDNHSQKRSSTIFLVSMFLVGLYLRISNLGGFPPFTDEYLHFSTAINLLNGFEILYYRAFATVTFPVFLSFKLFGISVFNGRLPIVLINMLSIFPLYKLAKKINKDFAYIAVTLFVFSPWIISTAMSARDYAVMPLILFSTAFVLTQLLDWESLSMQEYLVKNKYNLIVALGMLIYLIIDPDTINIITYGLYGIFAGLVGYKIFRHKPSILKISLFIIPALLIAEMMLKRSALYYRYLKGNPISYQTARIYWTSLVENQFRQWYSFPSIGYIIIFISTLFVINAIIYKTNHKNLVFTFTFAAFAGNLTYITYFIVNPGMPGRTRYGMLMEYWYLFLVAFSIFILLKLLKRLFGNSNGIQLTIFVTLLLFNFNSVAIPLNFRGGGRNLITGDKHYLLNEGYLYIVERLSPVDVLFTDTLDDYDKVNKNEFADTVILFDTNIEKEEFQKFLFEDHKHGWIAISLNFSPDKFGLPIKDTEFADTHLKYHGIISELQIWQWYPLSK